MNTFSENSFFESRFSIEFFGDDINKYHEYFKEMYHKLVSVTVSGDETYIHHLVRKKRN